MFCDNSPNIFLSLESGRFFNYKRHDTYVRFGDELQYMEPVVASALLKLCYFINAVAIMLLA